MLVEMPHEANRATPTGRILPPAPAASDPILAEYLLHSLPAAMGPQDVLVEEAPSHRPAMQKFMPMRGPDSFYTMATGAPRPRLPPPPAFPPPPPPPPHSRLTPAPPPST